MFNLAKSRNLVICNTEFLCLCVYYIFNGTLIIFFLIYCAIFTLSDSFPGLWEVPLVDYVDPNRNWCNFISSCMPYPHTPEDVLDLFYSNFMRHYLSNKAPFFMLLEADWLSKGINFNGKVPSFLKFFYFCRLTHIYPLIN